MSPRPTKRLRQSDQHSRDYEKFEYKLKANSDFTRYLTRDFDFDVVTDCYFTARDGGATNGEAQKFALAMFKDHINNRNSLDITDPELKAQLDKYKKRADEVFEKRSREHVRTNPHLNDLHFHDPDADIEAKTMNIDDKLAVLAKKAVKRRGSKVGLKRNALPKKHGGRKDVPKRGGSVRAALLRRIHKNKEIQELLLKNPKYDIIVVRKNVVKADDGIANLTNVGGTEAAGVSPAGMSEGLGGAGGTWGWPQLYNSVKSKNPKKVNYQLLKDYYLMARKGGADHKRACWFALGMHKHFRKKQEGDTTPLEPKLNDARKQYGTIN